MYVSNVCLSIAFLVLHIHASMWLEHYIVIDNFFLDVNKLVYGKIGLLLEVLLMQKE